LPARRRRHDRPSALAPRGLASLRPQAAARLRWPRSPSMASRSGARLQLGRMVPVAIGSTGTVGVPSVSRPDPAGPPLPTDPSARSPPGVKIQEADAKSLLVAQGLPVPPWAVAHTAAEARAAAERFLAEGPIGGKVVIKAQVLVGGRGKAGGVKLAGSPDEAPALGEAGPGRGTTG